MYNLYYQEASILNYVNFINTSANRKLGNISCVANAYTNVSHSLGEQMYTCRCVHVDSIYIYMYATLALLDEDSQLDD